MNLEYLDYLKAIGKPLIPPLEFYDVLEQTKLGVFQIPIKNFDGISISDFNSSHCVFENNCIEIPKYLEWLGYLSLGRFNKLKKKTSIYTISSLISAKELLEKALSADAYNLKANKKELKPINCEYFLFAEGKTGGRLIAELGQGTRRFASAYIKALEEGNVNLSVPCNLTLVKLNKEKTEELIKEIERILYSLNPEKDIKNIIRFFINFIINKINKKYTVSQIDKYCKKRQELEILKKFLMYQKMLEPVFENIKSILLGKFTPEDLEKVFDQINKFTLDKIAS